MFMDPGLEREIRSRNNQIRASGFVAECVVRSVQSNIIDELSNFYIVAECKRQFYRNLEKYLNSLQVLIFVN